MEIESTNRFSRNSTVLNHGERVTIYFILFDFVHLIKNIRNNWITEAMQELSYSLNGERKVAKWSDLKPLYHLESDEREKIYKLTEVYVSPKPIERQKVSFVLQVFNEKTISALKNHSVV